MKKLMKKKFDKLCSADRSSVSSWFSFVEEIENVQFSIFIIN